MSAVFDPSAYDAQLQAKVARLRDLLAPFGAPEPAVFDSPREHYRLRAEFRLWLPAQEAAAKNLASGVTSSDNRAGNGGSHPTTMPGKT